MAVTALEITAREKLDILQITNAYDVFVKTVFSAMWSSALPVETIAAIGNAMHGMTATTTTLKGALVRAVRAKVLRSRVQNGQRLYEVVL